MAGSVSGEGRLVRQRRGRGQEANDALMLHRGSGKTTWSSSGSAGRQRTCEVEASRERLEPLGLRFDVEASLDAPWCH